MAKSRSTKKKTTSKKSAATKSTSKKSTKKATGSKKSTRSSKTSAAASKKTTKTAKKAGKPTAKKSPTTKSAKTVRKTTRTPSTAKKTSKKKAAPRRKKSHLDRKQLKHFESLLLEKRVELIGDLVGMEDSALRGKDAANLSSMPLHMADIGSDNYDQELMLGLMESERNLLREIDEALERVQDGTFGLCMKTGKPINKARLEVKPWAKYCIEAVREMERSGR